MGRATVSKKLESTTPLHEKNTKNVDSAVIKNDSTTADVGVHTRALAARDKMTEDARRQTVMPPVMDEASTTQDIAERQKRCKASRDVESRRQSRAATKAANEHEIEMSRIDDKQQCSRKEAMTRNAQQAQWQQQHRAREQAAQHEKDTNLVEAERTQIDVERESTRRDNARRRKQRSRAAASALASQSTATMAADTVIETTTVAINTTEGITQGSHVESESKSISTTSSASSASVAACSNCCSVANAPKRTSRLESLSLRWTSKNASILF